MPIRAAVAAKSAATADPDRLLHAATALVQDDLDAVNRVIQRRLESDIALVRTLGAHIINHGGKRLRPLIVLLSARACDGDSNSDSDRHRDGARHCNSDSAAHISLAAVIEFIHTATLLHDDVVDASQLRRGRVTANQVWGNEASVLVGDFIYSRAFEMMVDLGSAEVMRELAATTNAIAEGEVMQLINTRAPDTTEQDYLDTIQRKTARLFESAARLGGVVGYGVDDRHGDGNDDRHSDGDGYRHATCNVLATYGAQLGIAFQMVDDMLDYRADDTLGKNTGDDLAEGKPTLPLIYAMQHGDARQRRRVRHAIEHGGREDIGEILIIIESTGALAYTAAQAKRHAAAAIAALSGLRESPYKDALINLAEFSVTRAH